MSNFEPPGSKPEPPGSGRSPGPQRRLPTPQSLRQAWQRFSASERVRRLTGGHPGLVLGGLTAFVGIVVLAVVLALVLAGSGAQEEMVQAPTRTPSPTAEETATPPTPAPTPTLESFNVGLQTPVPTGELTAADLAARERGEPVNGTFTGNRLVIPKIGVDAPLSFKVVGADGRMPPPNGPEDIAYYDFSAWPGLGGVPGVGGNAVFSGHVDYHDYGPAVLWDLRDLAPGDIIEIHLDDGSVFQYAVQWNKAATPESLNWNDVVASTAQESITIITCTGTFDPSVRQYDKRLVVWAIRIG